MDNTVVEFGGRYVLWSKEYLMPVSRLMTFEDLQRHLGLEGGYDTLDELEVNLSWLHETGSTDEDPQFKHKALRRNCAGLGDTHLTEAEIVERYSHRHPETVHTAKLDYTKAFELFDTARPDGPVLAVTDAQALDETVLLLSVRVPKTTRDYPVLVRMVDGKALNVGWENFQARNKPARKG